MAKAKEEFGASSSLEDELSCSICLSLYRNPVSLCCGHSFCKQCVQKALGVQQQAKASYSCPLCRKLACVLPWPLVGAGGVKTLPEAGEE
uniref:RING-type domain-containing protein n=1 Tax=Pavo cristatus TaxID=9049 RepID=A0A8C9FH00_PAVCR